MTSFYEELRKNDVISDEKENAQSRKNVDKWIFGLLLFLIGFMPLVVLANVEEVVSPLISNIDILSSGMKGDLFTHYKALLVILVTVITGAMLLAKVLFMGGTIRKTKLNYVLGVFVAAIVISTIASPNVTIALNGQYNRSDGAISWLCYVALMFIAMNIEYPKNVVRYIMYTMMPFVYINLYIITMNFYGKDLMQQAWVQKLVSIALPEGATISTGSQLVGTLNQWNYMSGMFAMMMVMYLAWAITSKKWTEIVAGVITASASIAIMFMSISTSGFITVCVSLIFIIVLVLKVESKLKAIVAIIAFLILTVPIFDRLAEKDIRVWNESFGFLINNNPYLMEVPVAKEKIHNELIFRNKVYASDAVFELPVLPERVTAFGSGRGYIWPETLKLVKKRPLFGYGYDSLVYNFPHFQLPSRNGMYDENTIVDKSHNVYIGVLFGGGIVGFIALLGLLIIVIVTLTQQVFNKNSELPILLIGNAILAYFIQAIFNDSLPSVSSIVFIFIGIMFALLFNYKGDLAD